MVSQLLLISSLFSLTKKLISYLSPNYFLSRLLLYREHGRRNLVLLRFLSLEFRYLHEIIYRSPSMIRNQSFILYCRNDIIVEANVQVCDGVTHATQYVFRI